MPRPALREDEIEAHLKEMVERFRRKVQILAKLHHPNIVSVHEVGRDDETVYIVSDLVEGVTLTALAGSTSQEFAEVVMPKAKLQTTDDYDQAIKLVMDGQADAMIAEVGRMETLIQNLLEVSRGGAPVVAYFDLTNRNLKVAHCNDAACGTATITAIDTSSTTGVASSSSIQTAAVSPMASRPGSPSIWPIVRIRRWPGRKRMNRGSVRVAPSILFSSNLAASSSSI